MAGDSVEINPLIPDSWDFFALDDVNYHGHRLAVIWDRSGKKYNTGKGLSVWLDGKLIGSSPVIRKLLLAIAPGVSKNNDKEVNLAVNNTRKDYFPRVFASFAGLGKQHYLNMNDGQFFYYQAPANRWTSEGVTDSILTAGIDFGVAQTINEVIVYFIDDASGKVHLPKDYKIQYLKNNQWQPVSEIFRTPAIPTGGCGNHISIHKISTTKIRLVLHSKKGNSIGISEIEVMGANQHLFAGNLGVPNRAYYKNAGFTCSYISPFDNREGINDGVANPTVRWTNYASANTSDWVSFSFKQKQNISRVLLFIYDDKGGVQPPASYSVEYWNGNKWMPVSNENKNPIVPTADLNICTFKTVETNKVRIVMKNKTNKIFCGLYEVELY